MFKFVRGASILQVEATLPIFHDEGTEQIDDLDADPRGSVFFREVRSGLSVPEGDRRDKARGLDWIGTRLLAARLTMIDLDRKEPHGRNSSPHYYTVRRLARGSDSGPDFAALGCALVPCSPRPCKDDSPTTIVIASPKFTRPGTVVIDSGRPCRSLRVHR
ncbi:hypothetical protein VTN02DRAFT_2061 [Thermoascus thermophilus]